MALPPATPFTSQLTIWLEVLFTLALRVNVPPIRTEPLEGVSVTEMVPVTEFLTGIVTLDWELAPAIEAAID